MLRNYFLIAFLFFYFIYISISAKEHCIKPTRETKSKATISLEKLIKIAILDVLFVRPTSFYHDTFLAITPVPLQFILLIFHLTNCFPFSRRQFYLHMWEKWKKPRYVDQITDRNICSSSSDTSIINLENFVYFSIYFYFFIFFGFFVNSICTYDYRYKSMDHKLRLASNQWHLTIITK